MPERLNLFVYGTLKRGERNHYRFCRGFASVEEGTVRGRLYDLPLGFPALVVPDEDVHAVGTADYASDAGLTRSVLIRPRAPLTGWENVRGELLVFDDPEERLPAIDALEGFRPGEKGFYTRVLVPVRLASRGENVLPAWVYSVEEGSGARLPGAVWPA